MKHVSLKNCFLKVSDSFSKNGNYAPINVSSGQNTKLPISVFVPGGLLQEASKVVEKSRRENTLSNSAPVRVSVMFHKTSVLFPAAKAAPVVSIFVSCLVPRKLLRESARDLSSELLTYVCHNQGLNRVNRQ